jgi:prepilin-type processing-associated H-X9-DG protein
MEQENLYRRWDHFNFGVNQRDENGVYNGPGWVFMRQQVKTLVCPSNPIAGSPLNVPADPADTDRGLYFLTSYYGSAGTRGYPRWATDGRLGLFQFRDGVFDQNRQHTMTAIADGTSNTLMFGERHYFDPVFDSTLFDGDPDKIANWGWCWFGAQGDAFLGASVRINYRLPANTTITAAMFDDRINAYGSGHTGGANFTLADGSVRFIRESVSPVTLLSLGTRAGGEVIANDF